METDPKPDQTPIATQSSAEPPNSSSNPITFNQWQPGTWADFLAIAQQTATSYSPQFQSYYQDGWMRFEMTPIGPEHGNQHVIPLNVANLYAGFQSLPIRGYINTSFRKEGIRACQPDLAFYIDRPLSDLPTGNSPIDLNQFAPPSLVVEIGSSSFADDLGTKRLLYERLGVAEYWVLNVATRSIIAFAIADGGSREIPTSQVLPGLSLAIVGEALERLDREDDGQITRWLINQFQLKTSI